MAATASTPLMEGTFGPEYGGKVPADAGYSVLPSFIFQSFVIFPIWVVLILPLMLIYKLIMTLLALCHAAKKPKPIDPFEGIDTQPAQSIQPVGERKYDFVLMGATGFTGQLAAEYIASEYGFAYKWAIAGRSTTKLAAVKRKIMEINQDTKSVDIIEANSANSTHMNDLSKCTKLVMTTVGPYAKYGSKLAAACARNGTHYCDITGEITWVRTVVENIDRTARTTGARIVFCCGHDSVPWDMAVHAASKAFEERKDRLVDIRFFDDIRALGSGGTIATLFNSFSVPLKPSKLGYDPMLMREKGDKSAYKIRTKLPTLCCGYNKEVRAYVGPFVMAPTNANVVRRSNALLQYSQKLKYYEVEKFPGCMTAWLSTLNFLWFKSSIEFPPFRLIHQCFLPVPGQGPPAEERKLGYMRVTGVGRSERGAKVIVRFGLTIDPGYEDTARILVESALCNISDEITKEGKSGVLTPACAFGSRLVSRLQEHGRGAHFSVTHV